MNCWEYKNCPEEVLQNCPAYPENGSDCWLVTGVQCDDGKIEFASLEEQIVYCGKCGFHAGLKKKGPSAALKS